MKWLKSPLWLPAILLVAVAGLLAQVGLSRMAEERSVDSAYYVVQVGAGAVDLAEQRLADAVAAEISKTARLDTGYPRTGRIVLTPVPGQPGASSVSCEQVPSVQGRGTCIRLNPAGDLIQFSLWRDRSAMPFTAALYLLEPGRTLDMYRTPWIMVQVMTVREWRLVEPSHAAVESVLKQLGAKSFIPKD